MVAEDGLREGRGCCREDASVIWLVITVSIISPSKLQMQPLLGIHDLDLLWVKRLSRGEEVTVH